MTHGQKVTVSVLMTVGLGMLSGIVGAFAGTVWPPRLGLHTLVLTPLAHLGFKMGWSTWLPVLLAIGPALLSGVILGRAWLRGRLLAATLVLGAAHGVAIVAAVLIPRAAG